MAWWRRGRGRRGRRGGGRDFRAPPRCHRGSAPPPFRGPAPPARPRHAAPAAMSRKRSGFAITSVRGGAGSDPEAEAVEAGTAGPSRFRLVRLPAAGETLRRGRWICRDFYEREAAGSARVPLSLGSAPSRPAPAGPAQLPRSWGHNGREVRGGRGGELRTGPGGAERRCDVAAVPPPAVGFVSRRRCPAPHPPTRRTDSAPGAAPKGSARAWGWREPGSARTGRRDFRRGGASVCPVFGGGPRVLGWGFRLAGLWGRDFRLAGVTEWAMGLGAGLSRDFRGGVSGSLVFGGGASGRLVLVVGSRFFGGGALPGVWRRGFRLQVFEGGAELPAPGSLGLPHVLGGVAWLQVLPFCRCFPIPNTPTGRKCGGGGGWEGGGSCNTPHPTLCYCRTYTNPGAVGEGGRTPHNGSILSPLQQQWGQRH